MIMKATTAEFPMGVPIQASKFHGVCRRYTQLHRETRATFLVQRSTQWRLAKKPDPQKISTVLGQRYVL